MTREEKLVVGIVTRIKRPAQTHIRTNLNILPKSSPDFSTPQPQLQTQHGAHLCERTKSESKGTPWLVAMDHHITMNVKR
jgi:hypothetical protein